MEVSPLSREVILPEAQPLSAQLQSGLRLLHPPIPAAPWARLTVCFPSRERALSGWENYGLTTFRVHARVG